MEIQSSLKKNAQFPFCGQTKAFRYEIVIQGIQPCFFFTVEPLACFEPNQGSEVFEKISGTFCTQRWRKVRF